MFKSSPRFSDTCGILPEGGGMSRLSTPRTIKLPTHQFDINQTDELNKNEQFSTLFCSDEKSSEQSKAENI